MHVTFNYYSMEKLSNNNICHFFKKTEKCRIFEQLILTFSGDFLFLLE